jgi:hypothetical protein
VRAALPLAIAFASAAPALADPPLVTEDAYIVDKGKCQVEGQARRQRDAARAQSLEFGCGFADWLELTFGRATERTTLLQAKVLPLPMDDSPYGYGFALGVSRSGQPGAASSDPFVNLFGGVKLLGERAALYASLGAERDRRASLTRGTAGVAGEYSINETLQLVAEVTARRGEKPAPLAGVRLFPVPEHMHVTAALGRRSYTLGFHWDF